MIWPEFASREIQCNGSLIQNCNNIVEIYLCCEIRYNSEIFNLVVSDIL